MCIRDRASFLAIDSMMTKLQPESTAPQTHIDGEETLSLIHISIFTMVFTKFYEEKVRAAATKVGGGKMVGLITTAMFVGMYSTLAAPHVTNVEKPLGIVAFIVAAAVTVLCTHISKKVKALKQFTFTISILAGMASASIISLF